VLTSADVVKRLAEVGDDVVHGFNTDADTEDSAALWHWVDECVDLAEAHTHGAHLYVIAEGAHGVERINAGCGAWLKGEHATPPVLEKSIGDRTVWVRGKAWVAHPLDLLMPL
jgi:hypothetical protein